MKLLRETTVQEARRERLAQQIASMTRLTVGAASGRLRRADGRKLLKNAFVDVWPSALDELGALPASKAAKRDDLVAELARLLEGDAASVRAGLVGARRGSDVRTALATLWGKGATRSLDEIAAMRAQEARSRGLSGRIAELLAIPATEARRRLDHAHGLSLVSTVFVGRWPASTPPGRRSRVASRYERIKKLGAGGEGHVWLARDAGIAGAPLVALKYLTEGGPEAAKAVLREFNKASVVTHPNLCKYIRTDEDAEGTLFLVIAYGGKSLSEHAANPVPVEQAVEWISAAAEGLDALHDANVWHLDVKPANLLIDESGAVRLTDFGMALGARPGTGKKLVPTSTVRGWSPEYFAPEVPLFEASERSDQYSLALTFCKLIGGDSSRLAARRHERLPTLSASQNAAVQRALSTDPKGRFSSCVEFAQSLVGNSWTDMLEKRWRAFLGNLS